MIDRDTEIVSRIRARLEAELGGDRFELWFGNGTRLGWSDGELQVRTDTPFRSDQLRRSLLTDIRRAARHVCGCEVGVSFQVDPLSGGVAQRSAEGCCEEQSACVESIKFATSLAGRPRRAVRSANGSSEQAAAVVSLAAEPHARPRASSNWSARSTTQRRFARLDALVAGPCNRLALGAAEMVILEPGQVNPLFIHGPSGTGKTHLLEGIWSEVRQRGGRRIIYLTAEQFTTYFLQALRGSGLPSFRQKYRAVDLLILDDIQFFVGKQATIIELLHTIDALLRDSGQIVMAADRSPSELAQLGAELRTRISGGLVCPLQPLDQNTRRTLLGQLVDRRQLPLDRGDLDRMAERAVGDARQLTGLVNRLWATHEALGRPLSVAAIDEILGELFPSSGGVIKLDDIQRVVCDEFRINPDQLRSDRRSRSVSHPRMLAMWLARKHTQAALTEIGEFFGRRSHSTVLSAQHKVERWVVDGQTVSCDKSKCDVRTLLTRLERTLRAHGS